MSIHGLVAVFDSPQDLVVAAGACRQAGYTRMDAYTPIPIHELDRALGLRPTRLPKLVLAGGVAGALTGFGLQTYLSVFAYPLVVGGKPLFSWPSFIPITFECTILAAALTAVLGMLGRNGLPRPHHPIFNTPHFELASRDKFFLCIEATDPLFDLTKTRLALLTLDPEEVSEVPR
jgi:hypothetical protein